MRILVLGASSQIGVFLLPLLAAHGHSIIAINRRAPENGHRSSEAVRWMRPDSRAGADLGSVQALVSCGPLDAAPGWIERLTGLERCIAFSSTSIHTRDNEQARALRRAESDLGERLGRQDIAFCLLRPTLVYGCGLDRNISLLWALGKRFGFIPVSSRAHGLRQPVHAGDLAEAVSRALSRRPAVNLAGEIHGAETLSYRAMADAIAAQLPSRTPVLALPPGLFRLIVRLARLRPAWRQLRTDMVDRQALDFVFDDESVRSALDIEPRPFMPGPDDFRIPVTAAALQLPVSSGGDT